MICTRNRIKHTYIYILMVIYLIVFNSAVVMTRKIMSLALSFLAATRLWGADNDLLHFQLLPVKKNPHGRILCLSTVHHPKRCSCPVLSVVPAIVVHPLPDQLNRWLSTIVLLALRFPVQNYHHHKMRKCDDVLRARKIRLLAFIATHLSCCTFFGMFKSSMKITFFLPAGGPWVLRQMSESGMRTECMYMWNHNVRITLYHQSTIWPSDRQATGGPLSPRPYTPRRLFSNFESNKSWITGATSVHRDCFHYFSVPHCAVNY